MTTATGNASGRVRVLVVEDDPLIFDFLSLGLGNEGLEVRHATSGESAIAAFRMDPADLVILDLMLPGIPGDEVCKAIRAGSDVPILVLTARDQVKDKISLLSLGADDYLVKPFVFDELLARVRALLRRSKVSQGQTVLEFSDIALDVEAREVTRAHRKVPLSAREFDLLKMFMENQRKVLAKQAILDRIWGDAYQADSNIVEVYVNHLRTKLGEPNVVQTVRGVGYSLRI